MYLSEPLAEEVIKALEELIISAENLINSDEKYKNDVSVIQFLKEAENFRARNNVNFDDYVRIMSLHQNLISPLLLL